MFPERKARAITSNGRKACLQKSRDTTNDSLSALAVSPGRSMYTGRKLALVSREIH